MKILIFLHGIVLMHKSALGKSREDRVQQIINSVFIKEFSGIDNLPDNINE